MAAVRQGRSGTTAPSPTKVPDAQGDGDGRGRKLGHSDRQEAADQGQQDASPSAVKVRELHRTMILVVANYGGVLGQH
jgi:hypothetical protein